MNSAEIREKFLSFFAERGHTRQDSSSLVPVDDPTLLFVNAGMVQFKQVFTGGERRDYRRATTCQRCVRAGGKHNDLENVGYTARHHTFFEMLGNFSFGDYFKEEAIKYAWEFLTEVLSVPRERLWITVFADDDEAFALWKKVPGILAGRIVRMGEKENFWAMGDTGPCGPCSEIHYDQGPEAGCGKPDCKLGCDCDRFLELWNLVFMQFERDAAGKLTPLPEPSIDTGMGLERIAAVLQGKTTNYDSDIFMAIIDEIAGIVGIRYGTDRKADTAMRVIADHARATTFLVADGVLPSNEGRGYVLRRIMRRAIRYGRSLGLKKPFMAVVTAVVIRQMRTAYPHLNGAAELLDKVINHEEERFLLTIDHGLRILAEEFDRLRGDKSRQVSGDFIFKLYDTFGFPVDIVRDMAMEQGFTIDEAAFNLAMAEQRRHSRQAGVCALPKTAPGLKNLAAKAGKTEFLGYETLQSAAKITAIIAGDGETAAKGGSGDNVLLACSATPFYAESGGQSGDQGAISGPHGRGRVLDTVKTAAGVFLHKVRVEDGEMAVGDPVQLRVTLGRRRDIAANHSATHLLQAVLRRTLGGHIKQAGSLVEAERLRFDFTHFSALSLDELMEIEGLVNEAVRRNIPVATKIMAREAAQKSGAMALFGEKYGTKVRVVSFGDFSTELCGGTHVGATGEIGLFKIISETGVAAGVRRLTAITGRTAFGDYQKTRVALTGLADSLKCSPAKLPVRISALLLHQKELEQEVADLTAKLSLSALDDMLAASRDVRGVKVVAAQITLDSPKTLREIGDRMRDKIGSGVIVLGGELNGKVALLAVVTNDLTPKCQAGRIVKEVAALVGGGGGGRLDMAQAGGTMVDKLPEALAMVYDIVAGQMTG